MTDMPPNASGSLLSELGPWLEVEGGVRLRGWQRAVLERLWAIDGDGRLCFRTGVVSTPRQSGKSWLARAWAVGRCQFPELFGDEPQTVGHMANNLQAAVRIHEQSWGWAHGRDLTVRKAKGSERVMWPDGGQWVLSSLNAIYGASLNGVILDEIWDIEPDTIREAVLPTQAARAMPQLLAVSTANPKATRLAGQLMADGRLGLRRTFLADWGASEFDDPADPKVWEQASPHWDDQRREEMELAAGTPGFTSQWLNVWPDSGDPWRWLPKALTDTAGSVATGWPAPGVGIVGVESRWNPSEERLPGRWSVAVAWPGGSELLAAVRRVDTLADVVELAGDRRIVCHGSVAEQLAALGRGRTQPVNSTAVRSSAETLADVLRSGGLRVSGIDDNLWASVRVAPGDGGDVFDPRKSLADVAPVKALSFAVHAARLAASRGPVLVA